MSRARPCSQAAACTPTAPPFSQPTQRAFLPPRHRSRRSARASTFRVNRAPRHIDSEEGVASRTEYLNAPAGWQLVAFCQRAAGGPALQAAEQIAERVGVRAERGAAVAGELDCGARCPAV